MDGKKDGQRFENSEPLEWAGTESKDAELFLKLKECGQIKFEFSSNLNERTKQVNNIEQQEKR